MTLTTVSTTVLYCDGVLLVQDSQYLECLNFVQFCSFPSKPYIRAEIVFSSTLFQMLPIFRLYLALNN